MKWFRGGRLASTSTSADPQGTVDRSATGSTTNGGMPLALDSPRLRFVDGLRGLAALVVCVGHLLAVNGALVGPPGESIFRATPLQLLGWLFVPWGSDMVNLFLLVSGFSLTYAEEARRAKGRPPTRLKEFGLRRFYRLAPIYYVALLIGLAVFVLPLGVDTVASPIFHDSVHITLAGTAAHLGFVQNLSGSWLYQGNSPLWSMAYEVQLYLIFPLLYWASKRVHPLLVVVAAIGMVGAIARLNPGFPVFGLMRWFVVGIALALLYRRIRVPAPVLAVIAGGSFLVAIINPTPAQGQTAHDLVWMSLFVSAILLMASRPASGRNPLNGSIFGWLGERSYSLYALHFPLAYLVFAAITALGVGGARADGLELVVALPLSLGLAALGYRLLERPALRRSRAVGITPAGRADRGQ